ncbi:MAG TPA: ABC transporter substrate-binding protein [Gaiellales bacterium]|jgi:peptide/nickel transport system substrate-binding protein|nr:ABC transporter substrate-binding protein [Gaiellales bacterium]
MSGDTDHANRGYTRREVVRGALGAGAAFSAAPLLAACGGGSSTPSSSGGGTGGAGSPKPGGDLRVGMLGGSSSDTLDAGRIVTEPDTIRAMALYSGLVRLSNDARSVEMDLAEEVTPSADAKEWTVRLRQGLTFHNGKPVTTDDVIFSLKRIVDPKSPGNGAAALAPLDVNAIKAMDARTLRLPMKTPYASFLDQICNIFNFPIVPTDYDPKNPVGTGPFKYQSFTPGQRSVFAKFPDYYLSGLPYLDSITIIDNFASDTAAFNALQGGELDVFSTAPLNLAKQIEGNSALTALVSLPGQWTPFTMRVDKAPFTDNNVRQAMRYIVDRQQLIDLSLDGLGAVGNDVFSQWDPDYDTSLKRDQDLDKAKSLLKQAGQEGLTVELNTADFAVGVLQAAQVFAEQAKGAGVTVKVNQVPVGTFYGPNYLQWTFAQDFWGYSPYLSQVAQGSLSTAPFNETHWNDAQYVSLYNQANATTDDSKRKELVQEMQKIDFDQGGYIIAAYNKLLDITTSKVHGFEPAGTGIVLGNADWAHAWMS